ncbi:hypothetical protein [Chryseolinea serpens]|uniref:hypothetical protein n=1 Tax=Chryseolinea serpens TaxID=947013 RepID=UPI001160F5D1|nr:hypothetical protein [Chryseolinea serpens]
MRRALGSSISFIENGIYHEDRLVEACALRRECIDRFMLPFFQNFSTLRAVNDQLIDTIPWVENRNLDRFIPRGHDHPKLSQE